MRQLYNHLYSTHLLYNGRKRAFKVVQKGVQNTFVLCLLLQYSSLWNNVITNMHPEQ